MKIDCCIEGNQDSTATLAENALRSVGIGVTFYLDNPVSLEGRIRLLQTKLCATRVQEAVAEIKKLVPRCESDSSLGFILSELAMLGKGIKVQ